MRKLKDKLRSSRGASMIIAMVFMLICIFVGGSILTAATANAYRIKHLSGQQQFLSRRSAAMLVTSQLTPEDHSVLRLKVRDTSRTIVYGRVLENGEFKKSDMDPIQDNHSLEFSIEGTDSLNAMQRLLFESAIRNYIKEHGVVVANLDSLIIRDFNYNSGSGRDTAITSLDSFWLPASLDGADITKNIHFSGKQHNDGDLANFDLVFCTKDGADYDISWTFQEPAGSALTDPSRLEIQQDAALGSSVIPTIELVTKVGGRDAKVTTDSTITSIAWAAPKITKGAA